MGEINLHRGMLIISHFLGDVLVIINGLSLLDTRSVVVIVGIVFIEFESAHDYFDVFNRKLLTNQGSEGTQRSFSRPLCSGTVQKFSCAARQVFHICSRSGDGSSYLREKVLFIFIIAQSNSPRIILNGFQNLLSVS